MKKAREHWGTGSSFAGACPIRVGYFAGPVPTNSPIVLAPPPGVGTSSLDTSRDQPPQPPEQE